MDSKQLEVRQLMLDGGRLAVGSRQWTVDCVRVHGTVDVRLLIVDSGRGNRTEDSIGSWKTPEGNSTLYGP